MLTSIFGPDANLILPEEKLFALPANWMVAACMESPFRRLSGWLGLAQAPSSSRRAFTCRVKSRPGVFGVLPLKAETGDKAHVAFRIYYFPAIEEDDPALDQISIQAMMALASPAFEEMVRDFPSHEDFADLFAIAEMQVILTHPQHHMACSLHAPTHRRIVSEAGVKTEDGAWLVPEGEFEEDLPAFEIAKDLFSVLAAGLSASLKRAPKDFLSQKNEAFLLTHKKDGELERSQHPDIYQRTEALLWDSDLKPFFPQAKKYEDAEIARLLRIAAGEETLNKEEENLLKLPYLVVLSGFLGSGKTSFLNQFIEFHIAKDELVAVIQNELGETGVDANLLEGEDSVVALDAGCVCCTLAGSLTRGIRQITDKMAPEAIVLETTGLANPLNMIEEFEELSDLAILASVVAVVDASAFWENLKASEVASEQIRAADTVILNKCDLVDEEELEKIKKEILLKNPETKIIHATHGRVNPNALGETISRYSKKKSCSCGTAPCGHSHDHHHDHDHEHHHHHNHGIKHDYVTHLDEGFSALKFILAPEVDSDELMNILGQTPTNILRIKGLAQITGTEKAQVIQYTAGKAALEPAARPMQEDPFLLIIGKNLDHEALKKLWLPLLKD